MGRAYRIPSHSSSVSNNGTDAQYQDQNQEQESILLEQQGPGLISLAKQRWNAEVTSFIARLSNRDWRRTLDRAEREVEPRASAAISRVGAAVGEVGARVGRVGGVLGEELGASGGGFGGGRQSLERVGRKVVDELSGGSGSSLAGNEKGTATTQFDLDRMRWSRTAAGRVAVP